MKYIIIDKKNKTFPYIVKTEQGEFYNVNNPYMSFTFNTEEEAKAFGMDRYKSEELFKIEEVKA